MFSTGNDDWQTPPEVFDPLMAAFGFTVDVAAGPGNHRLPRWFGEGGEQPCGLAADWRGEVCWMNPPYSRKLQPRFVEKAAVNAALNRVVTVALLPARTDTIAFHDWIWDRNEHKPYPWVRSVRFLRGRVRFVGAPSSAPFPSMIVVFGLSSS